MKRIAICADDFGLHAGINEAILRLATMRRVTAVSCLVGGPAWKEGAATLRTIDDGRMDIGLHLDFTECPLLSGNRRRLPALIAHAYARLLDPVRIAAEIDEQLSAFEDAMGRQPDHVDGHRHVHQLPVIREALIATLWRRYPEWRPWLRNTRRPAAPAQPPHLRIVTRKAWLVERLGAGTLNYIARRYGYPQNRALLGIYSYTDCTLDYASLFDGWLTHANDGDMLTCHPSAHATDDDPRATARMREFGVLNGAGFDTTLLRAGIQLEPPSRTQRTDRRKAARRARRTNYTPRR